MKKRMAFFVATLLLVARCQKTESPTATASPETPILTESVRPPAEDVTATVTFLGLTAHVLGEHQRAVIVYTDPDSDPPHPRLVTIRPAPEGADGNIVKKLKGQCLSDSCTFKVNYLSMQLLNGKGEALKTPLTSSDGTFHRRVPNLYEVNSAAFAFNQLASEVTGDLVHDSKISWGHFDLRGGDASSTKHPCPAKVVPGTNAYTEFPLETTVRYNLTGGGTLRVVDSSKQTFDIPLSGSNVAIEIDNNVQSSESHFHEFAKLSTSASLTLPEVKLDLSVPACERKNIIQQGGVPGCHDTKIVESGGA